jgi:hypothetical protein
MQSESLLSCFAEAQPFFETSLKERASRMQSKSLLSCFAEAQPFFETKSQRPHKTTRYNPPVGAQIQFFYFIIEPLGTWLFPLSSCSFLLQF